MRPLHFIFFLFSLTNLHPTTASSVVSATKDYLKLPLLHKTPLTSPTQTILFDIHRLSNLHHHHHKNQKGTIKSPIVSGAPSGSGQYFVKLRLGSPPQSLLVVVDTGSDLLWVTCSACRHNCPTSTFLPRHSSSFSPHHCYNPACRLVPHPDPNPCNKTRLHSPCRYQYFYSDGSTTTGFFSKDTTTLNTSSGKVAKLNNLSFGCGFQISGPSITGPSFNGAHGVVGLGRGPISFSSQLGRHFGNKFSYCLMDYTLSPPPTSYLVIGSNNENKHIPISNKTAIMSFTPLLMNPLSPTFYYIDIKGVSINGVKLRIPPSVWSLDEVGNGGTIIDSGTTLTFLPELAYVKILRAIEKRVKLASPVKLTPGFDLCFNVSGENTRLKLPRVSFELSGGSVLKAPPRNYFIDTEEGVKCLAMQAVGKGMGFSVIGNLMQQGFLFEFDTDKSRLGFSRRGCSLGH